MRYHRFFQFLLFSWLLVFWLLLVFSTLLLLLLLLNCRITLSWLSNRLQVRQLNELYSNEWENEERTKKEKDWGRQSEHLWTVVYIYSQWLTCCVFACVMEVVTTSRIITIIKLVIVITMTMYQGLCLCYRSISLSISLWSIFVS